MKNTYPPFFNIIVKHVTAKTKQILFVHSIPLFRSMPIRMTLMIISILKCKKIFVNINAQMKRNERNIEIILTKYKNSFLTELNSETFLLSQYYLFKQYSTLSDLGKNGKKLFYSNKL